MRAGVVQEIHVLILDTDDGCAFKLYTYIHICISTVYMNVYIELIIGFSPSLIFLQDRSVYPTGPNRITGWRQLFLS